MSAENDWPFEAWLKLAVRSFRLSPQQFWDMSLRDWLALTRAETVQSLSLTELSMLQIKFPDKIKEKEIPHDID